MEQTGLLIVDGLTSSRTLLALQTLIPVALLEQTILLTFNELLALLALQTLRLVPLLEQRDLLTFNGLII